MKTRAAGSFQSRHGVNRVQVFTFLIERSLCPMNGWWCCEIVLQQFCCSVDGSTTHLAQPICKSIVHFMIKGWALAYSCEIPQRRFFSYRDVFANLSCNQNDGHYSKWPPLSTILSISPLLIHIGGDFGDSISVSGVKNVMEITESG